VSATNATFGRQQTDGHSCSLPQVWQSHCMLSPLAPDATTTAPWCFCCCHCLHCCTVDYGCTCHRCKHKAPCLLPPYSLRAEWLPMLMPLHHNVDDIAAALLSALLSAAGWLVLASVCPSLFYRRCVNGCCFYQFRLCRPSISLKCFSLGAHAYVCCRYFGGIASVVVFSTSMYYCCCYSDEAFNNNKQTFFLCQIVVQNRQRP